MQFLLSSHGVASRLEYFPGARDGSYGEEREDENKGNFIQSMKVTPVGTKGIKRGEIQSE